MSWKFVYIFVALILPVTVFSQTIHFVQDSVSKEPIPYVNILVQNEHAGTTSNEKGEFLLSDTFYGKTIVFSAIGYKSKRIIYTNSFKVINLQPVVTELQEVTINPSKKSEKLELEKFKKSDIETRFGNRKYPWVLAHYFPFDETFRDTPFLEIINIYTVSKVANAKFIIKLYSKNKDGSPGELLYHENIIATAKKGRHITQVNVGDLNIIIPETGIFIGLEVLMIETNKHEFRYTKPGSKEVFKEIEYNPSIGGLLVDEEPDSWYLSFTDKIQWHKFSESIAKATNFHYNKFLKLAISITLSN